MATKGWGPLRAEWYSICSAHQRASPDSPCPRCQAGEWTNCWGQNIDHVIYKAAYPLWHWWHNRPNSHSKRFLRRWFPNLR